MAEERQRGGILALVRLDRETDGALTADMMERLGCTLAGAPHVYGWHAVAMWAQNLPQGCAVWRARHPEEAAFASDYGRALLSADIFDAILHAARSIAVSVGADMRQPKPHRRPNDGREAQHIGAGAIPVSDFDAWYYGT